MSQPQLPQVDLPPISVARYLDLVRRRRWQVIPVSILGLLVGALVAFMIPRYYVASTWVVYRGDPADPQANTASDPMADVVAGAEIYIPQAVPEAIDQLGWPEGRGDPVEVQSFVESVRDRLQVTDVQREKGRKLVKIVIRYADEDGDRSAALCNAVRDIWIRTERERLRERADQVHKNLTTRLNRANQEYTAARGDLYDFETQHDIDSIAVRSKFGQQESAISNALADLEARQTELRFQLAQESPALDRKKRQLSVMPRTLDKASEASMDKELKQRLDVLRLQELTLRMQLEEVTRAYPGYTSLKAALKGTQEEIAEVYALAQIGNGSAEQPLNPEWVELKEEIDTLQDSFDATTAQLDVVEQKIEDYRDRKAELPKIQRDWDQKIAEVARAEAQVEAINAELAEASSFLSPLTNDPIERGQEALVQPAPTEPNIYLVALAGSLVGLGAVIVLILLMDVLQSTFKTVGDVEHALALPVLGTMAHMESEEVRDETTRMRRRKAVLASLTFALVLSLIIVYYVDPTRLPEAVRHVLSLILDEPGR